MTSVQIKKDRNRIIEISTYHICSTITPRVKINYVDKLIICRPEFFIIGSIQFYMLKVTIATFNLLTSMQFPNFT